MHGTARRGFFDCIEKATAVHGRTGRGLSRLWSGQAWCGGIWRGPAGLGEDSLMRFGTARRGYVGRGWSRQGTVGLARRGFV